MSNRLLLAATLSIVVVCFFEVAATAQPRPPENDVSSASAKYFPNLVMRSQDDVPVHFYEDLLKGKVVLINFIFTTCQGVCSPMTANLARVQSYLAEHMDKE